MKYKQSMVFLNSVLKLSILKNVIAVTITWLASYTNFSSLSDDECTGIDFDSNKQDE